MSSFLPAPNMAEVVTAAATPELLAVAGDITTDAARIAPVDKGYYRRSFSVFDDDRGVGAETVDFAGHIIEWGSERTRPHGTLRTAAAANGDFEPK